MKLSRIYREICVPLEVATGRTVVIAGGAVRDHLLGRKPRDYDVFILTGKMGSTSVAKVVKDTRNWVLVQNAHAGSTDGVAYVHFPTTNKYGSAPVLTPIAEFYFWGHKVQVMCSPVADTKHLLETFDYNICRLFYPNTKHSSEYSVVANIKAHGTLVLTASAVTDPMFTLSRGMEFAQRYGMKMYPASMKQLCAAVVNGGSTLPTMAHSAVIVKKPTSGAAFHEGLYSTAAATTLKSMLGSSSFSWYPK